MNVDISLDPKIARCGSRDAASEAPNFVPTHPDLGRTHPHPTGA